MPQIIHCQTCGADTAAHDIVDLIKAHTNDQGRFPCGQCAGTDTFIHKKTDTPRAGRAGERWIKGLLPIETKTRDAAASPFVFLTADVPDGEVTGIEFKYYKTRAERLKHGRGAGGGGPVLGKAQLLALVGRLVTIGVVSPDDLRRFATEFEASVMARAAAAPA
jgi:hypothetical protein